ncbi:MAG: hypothetical protein GY899_01305 [Verrucomicrobiaceae bacterium]|nr:hypothetical protein [Verrucomicrobiaceae bacterium]
MAELNHFRKYAIAQGEEGDPLEILRDQALVVCLGFDTSRYRFVEIGALTSGDHDAFIRKARTASSIRHPSIASVIDYGKEEGSCYYVCDFVDGEVFCEYADRVKSIAPETAILWLLQLAQGCAALEVAGLQPDVSSARLRMTGDCNASPLIVDHGINGPVKKRDLGRELADLLESLTNYQDPGEKPVYPPEVENLSATLRGIGNAEEAVDVLESTGFDCDDPGFSPGQRPRLVLEKQLYRTIRPEHVLPERYTAIQRAGEVTPYECIVEDSGTSEMLRVLILPPERVIPERMLDIFESTGCVPLINTVAFWKHEDFRLLAERIEPGFTLAEWLDAVPRCEASDIAVILRLLEGMFEEVAAATFNPRLHPADIYFVFPEELQNGENILSEDLPISNWPEFHFMVRAHRTIRSLTDITHGDVPGGADEVFAAAERGEWVPTKLIVSWYLSLWRRGLVHQAGELVATLRESSGVAEPDDESRLLQSESFPDENQITLSPIAEAMGIMGDDGLNDPEEVSNPIARQIWLGDEPDGQEIGEECDESEQLLNPAEKGLRVIFYILGAVAVAVSISHCSGNAFWL